MLSLFGSKARSAFKNLSIEKLSIFLVEKMSKVLMACIQTDPKCVSFDLVFQFLILVELERALVQYMYGCRGKSCGGIFRRFRSQIIFKYTSAVRSKICSNLYNTCNNVEDVKTKINGLRLIPRPGMAHTSIRSSTY